MPTSVANDPTSRMVAQLDHTVSLSLQHASGNTSIDAGVTSY